MVTVLQCLSCKTIIGDTDVPVVAAQEGIEVKYAVGVELARNGRVKCESCKETIGTEDAEGRYFYDLKAVRKYTVQSSIKPVTSNAGGEIDSQGGKKRRKGDAAEGNMVSAAEFDEFKTEYMKEMIEVKEALMGIYGHLKIVPGSDM